MRARLTESQFAGMVASKAALKTRKPLPLEKDVQGAIKDWLRLQGFFVLRQNSGAFAGEYKGKRRFVRFTDRPGVSDLFFAKGQVWGYCEVKRPGAHPTLPQMAFLADVRRHGGIGITATSIDEVRAALQP